MKKIRWLHLSDIHLNQSGVDTRRMRLHLLEYLKSRDIVCDYIFFTGDLRYAPAGDFAEDTIAFLEALCQAVGTDKRHLFVVPGNHDIDRNCRERRNAIERISSEHGYYHPSDGRIQNEDLAEISLGKKQYIRLMEQLFSGNEQRLTWYRDSEKPHFCVETEDFNILHIDSTLTYSENRERDLIVGTNLLMDLFETLNREKTSVILTHYSFDFLSRNEQKQVLKLMEDYNVQLWFSGHEHAEILRRQRDYFFEFQCGNLLHEDEDTRSAVITGEYDPQMICGMVQVHVWNSPNGWSVDPFIGRGRSDKSIYTFQLQDSESRIRQFADLAREDLEDGRKEEKREGYIDVPKDMVPPTFKMAVGIGTADDYENGAVHKGFLYLDGSIQPFEQVRIHIFQKEQLSWYIVAGDGWLAKLLKYEEKYISQEFSYKLSGYPDVADRLYRFGKIRKYIRASQATVRISGDEREQFSYRIPAKLPDWEVIIQETEFWYDCTIQIAEIEQSFGIKFMLPEKAADIIYHMIYILNNSIKKKSCRYLPGIPMKHPGIRRKFQLTQEVILNDGSNLPELNLFGFVFCPVAQYILPGTFLWNKKNRTWESDPNTGGISVRVEFVLKANPENEREAVFAVPFEEFAKKYPINLPTPLKEEEAGLMRNYLVMFRDIQEVHRTFLYFESQIKGFMKYDLADGEKTRFDSLKVNELTEGIVSAGMNLVERLDKFHNDRSQEIRDWCPETRKQIADYGGYLFLVFMKAIFAKGYLPVSQDAGGELYYDLDSLENRMKVEMDEELKMVFRFLKESLRREGYCTDRIGHYVILRNFMYAVGEVYMDYHREYYPVTVDYTDSVQCLLKNEEAADLEEWEGCNLWLDNAEERIYVCRRDFRLSTQFSLYQLEAKRFFEENVFYKTLVEPPYSIKSK